MCQATGVCVTHGCNRASWNGQAEACCRSCSGSEGATHGPVCDSRHKEAVQGEECRFEFAVVNNDDVQEILGILKQRDEDNEEVEEKRDEIERYLRGFSQHLLDCHGVRLADQPTVDAITAPCDARLRELSERMDVAEQLDAAAPRGKDFIGAIGSLISVQDPAIRRLLSWQSAYSQFLPCSWPWFVRLYVDACCPIPSPRSIFCRHS